jgi:hypothetical protein
MKQKSAAATTRTVGPSFSDQSLFLHWIIQDHAWKEQSSLKPSWVSCQPGALLNLLFCNDDQPHAHARSAAVRTKNKSLPSPIMIYLMYLYRNSLYSLQVKLY